MTAATLTSTSGAVSVNTSLADLFRLTTTESITSWSVSNVGVNDSKVIQLEIVRSSELHTISWSGLVDDWLGDAPGEPTVNERQILTLLLSNNQVIGDNPDPATNVGDSVGTLTLPGGVITADHTIWEAEATTSATIPAVPVTAERSYVLRCRNTATTNSTISLPTGVTLTPESAGRWSDTWAPNETREVLFSSYPTYPGRSNVASFRVMDDGTSVPPVGGGGGTPAVYTGGAVSFSYSSQSLNVAANLVKEGTLLVALCCGDGSSSAAAFIDPAGGFTTGGSYTPSSSSGSQWRWWYKVFTPSDAGSAFTLTAGTTAGATYGSQSLAWMTFDGGSLADPLTVILGQTGGDLTSPLAFSADSALVDSVCIAAASTVDNTNTPGSTPTGFTLVGETMPNWRGAEVYRSTAPDADGDFPAFNLDFASSGTEISGLTLFVQPAVV